MSYKSMSAFHASFCTECWPPIVAIQEGQMAKIDLAILREEFKQSRDAGDPVAVARDYVHFAPESGPVRRVRKADIFPTHAQAVGAVEAKAVAWQEQRRAEVAQVQELVAKLRPAFRDKLQQEI